MLKGMETALKNKPTVIFIRPPKVLKKFARSVWPALSSSGSPSVYCGTISTVNAFAIEIVPQQTEGWAVGLEELSLSHPPSLSSMLLVCFFFF